VALGVSTVTAAIAAAASLADFQMDDRLLASPSSVSVNELVAADERRVVLGWVALIGFVASAGFLITWTRRLYGNLRPLGVTDLRFGVGWAVGGWFVPFLNLVRPKQVVDDIWRGSNPERLTPQYWRGEDVGGILHLWWAVWIIGVVVRLGTNNEPSDPDTLRGAMAWQAIGYGTVAVGGLLTLVVVRRLTGRQERCASLRLGVTLRPGGYPTAAVVAASASLGLVAFGAAVAVLDHGGGAAASTGHAVLTTDLHVGDCFDLPETLASAGEGETVPIVGVDLVDCDKPHDSEIFAFVDHPAAAGTDYPGTDEWLDFADRACVDAFDAAVGQPFADSGVQLYFFVPLTPSWAQGERAVRCAATQASGRQLEGSVLDSATQPTPSTTE
jgi:hypothetical protein